jgi:hypothetical protein
MLTSGYLCCVELLPAWASIMVAALDASVSNETEHGLTHRQYFPHWPFTYNVMTLHTWLMRPNTINPWYSRVMHLLHHKNSGFPNDVEERLVENVITYSMSRFVVMFDGFLGLCLCHRVLRRKVNNFRCLN